MSDKEIKDFSAIIQGYKLKLAKDKSLSKKLLVSAGIITVKGNLRKPYRNLCTVEGQA